MAMRYLCFQRLKTPSGGLKTTPIVRTKDRRYGPVVNTEIIGRKTPTLITGLHDSGKSRMLERLHTEERAIWGAKIKAPAIWLGALRPIGAWSDAPHVGEWWDKRAAELDQKKTAGEPVDPNKLRAWAKLKAWEKTESLPDYVSDTGAVVFLDDCHKLAGRKLQIARACAMTARVWVASASSEARIPPNLRSVMLRREPQIIRLGSDVAYDATDAMTWMLAVLLIAAGAWEAGAIVAGLKALSSSRMAAKQDA
jgi:hypothetical protein